jgi:iron(III) transport system substrate-binding protein
MKTIVSAAALVAASLFAIPASAANLVLYTSQPNEDAQATVDGFMAANPDIKVDWVRDGTPKIMAKLQAEIQAGNPVADVLLIADVVTLERLKEDGRLLAYKSPEAAGYDAALYDADGYYYSTKLITTGIMYNTSASMKPASWKDLTKPEARASSPCRARLLRVRHSSTPRRLPPFPASAGISTSRSRKTARSRPAATAPC